MVKTIANCFNLAFFSAPIAVPALANANGIVIHAPQKFSLTTIYLLTTSWDIRKLYQIQNENFTIV